MKTKVTHFIQHLAFSPGLLTLLACAWLAVSAAAADGKPPERISYQGNVFDANGVALGTNSPVNYDVVFRIFSAAQGGSPVWSEQQTVTIDKGYFSVLLGEGSQVGSEPHVSFSQVFSGSTISDRYIGITVKVPNQTDIEIAPRLRLVSSPYSFLAANAKSMVADDGTTIVYAATGKVGIKKDTPATELDVNGTVTANIFSGNGSALTALNAANISAGTLNASRMPNLDASKITSGTFDSTRIPNLDATKITGNFASMSFSGNVGIGTTTPAVRLEISGGSARIDANNVLEFGGGVTKQIDAGKIGYGTYSGDSLDIVGAGSDGLSRKVRFYAEGGVTMNTSLGVGTSPVRALHVSSSDWVVGRLDGNNASGTWLSLGNSSSGGRYFQIISSGSGNGEGAGKLLIGTGDSDSGTSVRVTVQADGKVGIGTSSPVVPLEVKGSATLNKSYGYLNDRGGTGTAGGANPYTIIAEGRVGAAEFNAFSDARIKNVVGRSDAANDLRTIQKLQVTDYALVDKIAEGSAVKKGFIAQEVEKVIPEAVSQSRRFVPDVYALAASLSRNEKEQTITAILPKAHGLQKGDRVQVFADDVRLEWTVASVPAPETAIFEKCDKAPKQLFVYGKEVSDFRTLNYDRIFTTGISAIQELGRQVEDLKSRQARMAELEAKAAKVDALEREMSELKKLVSRLAESRGTQTAEAPGSNRSSNKPSLTVSRLND